MANNPAEATTVQNSESFAILIMSCCNKIPIMPNTKAVHQRKEFFINNHPFNIKTTEIIYSTFLINLPFPHLN